MPAEDSALDESRAESRHPTLQKAIGLVERHFSATLSVASIAQASSVSYGYLSRLFPAELGFDVVGYIRQRRIGHSEHLLRIPSRLSLPPLASRTSPSSTA